MVPQPGTPLYDLALLGVRSLSTGYLTNVRLLLRGVPKRTRSRLELVGPAMRWITGRPSGRAAFSFIYSMAKTDWHFRLSLLPVLFPYVFFPIITIVHPEKPIGADFWE